MNFPSVPDTEKKGCVKTAMNALIQGWTSHLMLKTAYVGAFAHPFYSVTGADGKFTISGLDPGTYEITAWHERLGTKTASVTVGASGTKTQDFKFTTPAAK